MKKLLLTCMLAFSIFALSACTAKDESADTLDPAVEQSLNATAESLFDQFLALPDDQIDEMIEEANADQDTVLAAGLSSWQSSKKDLGELVKVDSVETEIKSDGETVTTVSATFEKRACKFTFGMDKRQKNATEITFTPHYTVGENMAEAAGNLVVGMGTVFAVLIFISWIISLFKYINPEARAAAKAKKEAKQHEAEHKEPEAEKTAVQVPAAPAAAPVMDDTELEAVIAAAIAAYEADNSTSAYRNAPVCADGITIRSIRRVSRAHKK